MYSNNQGVNVPSTNRPLTVTLHPRTKYRGHAPQAKVATQTFHAPTTARPRVHAKRAWRFPRWNSRLAHVGKAGTSSLACREEDRGVWALCNPSFLTLGQAFLAGYLLFGGRG